MFPRFPHMFCQQFVVGETLRKRGEALMFETWTEALLFPRAVRWFGNTTSAWVYEWLLAKFEAAGLFFVERQCHAWTYLVSVIFENVIFVFDSV
jgi:hypothetical protein